MDIFTFLFSISNKITIQSLRQFSNLYKVKKLAFKHLFLISMFPEVLW